MTKLADPFPPERVHWRIQRLAPDRKRGLAVCYIDARDVMDRLDEVVGPMGWQTRLEAVAGRVVCSIGIWCPDRKEWIWKSDGAGDSDIEPEKGGISDAFKRAAVHWGVGRYLYRIQSGWVDTEPAGKTGAHIASHERAKLQRLLPGSVVNGEPMLHPSPAERAKQIAEELRAAPSRKDLVLLYQKHLEEVRAMPDKIKMRLAEIYNDALASFADQ